MGNMAGRWIELVAGLWVIASPWILGFSGITLAKWSNVIAGVVIVLIPFWEIFGGRQKVGGPEEK